MKILEWFSNLSKLPVFTEIYPIPEGPMAHEITDEKVRKLIQEKYDQLHNPEPTPYTHPDKYDPFNPPKGWAYDPYYEFWLKTHDPR